MKLSLVLVLVFVVFAVCLSAYRHRYGHRYGHRYHHSHRHHHWHRHRHTLERCTNRTVALKERLSCLKDKVCECKNKAVPCPAGFVRHEEKCYWFAPKGVQATWAEARTICDSFNSYLAIFSTASEGKFAKDYLTGNSENDIYWIGASDQQVEGTFNWATKGAPIPVNYTDWQVAQPDDGQGTEDCVELRYSFGFQWNDWYCHEKAALICMQDLEMPKCT